MLNRPYDIYGLSAPYENEDPKNLLAVHIVKNRSGEVGMIPFETEMKYFDIWERPERFNNIEKPKSRRKVKVTVETNDDQEEIF